MPVFICKTHNITIQIEGNTRKISVNLANRGKTQCKIPKTKDITEGTFDDCVIQKIKD